MNLYGRTKQSPYMVRYKSWRGVGKTHEEAHELAKAGKTRRDVEIENAKSDRK